MKSCLLALLLCSGLLTSACGDSRSCDQVDCDDLNPCTVDACNPDGIFCENEALPDAADCETDGAVGLCAAGACAALICEGVDCDDGNPCTVDACFSDSDQCANLPLPALSLCKIDGSFGTCHQEVCDLNLTPWGEVELRVELVDVDARGVSYELLCANDTTLSGALSSLEGAWNVSGPHPHLRRLS